MVAKWSVSFDRKLAFNHVDAMMGRSRQVSFQGIGIDEGKKKILHSGSVPRIGARLRVEGTEYGFNVAHFIRYEA